MLSRGRRLLFRGPRFSELGYGTPNLGLGFFLVGVEVGDVFEVASSKRRRSRRFRTVHNEAEELRS